MSTFYKLDFEQPVLDIEQQIEQLSGELRRATDPPAEGATPLSAGETRALALRIDELRALREKTLRGVYRDLTAWETVRIARHPKRPQTRDYIDLFCRDFCELHGDRRFGDDPAMVTGFARIGPLRCMVIGHQKGRTIKERMDCHFGCAHPEGYRKALAKMKLAERFGLPVVTLINTPGAYPGIGAEERGQAWAIAENILEMSRLKVPTICIVIGEGGSGGALGIGVGDRVLMLQYAYYSVISPEGCASILWRDGGRAADAAKVLRLTSEDLLRLGVVDEVLPEPLGGAHRDAKQMVETVKSALLRNLAELEGMDATRRMEARYARLRALGNGVEPMEPVV